MLAPRSLCNLPELPHSVGRWLPTATGSFKAWSQNPQNLPSATFSWSKQVPSLARIWVEGKEIPRCEWTRGMHIHHWEEFLASVFRNRSTSLALLFLHLAFPPSLFLHFSLPSKCANYLLIIKHQYIFI